MRTGNRLSCGGLVVCVLVGVLCVAALPDTPVCIAQRAHLSGDPQINQAREFIHSRRYQDALNILRPHANHDRADITDIRFLIGLAAMRLAQSVREAPTRNDLLREAIIALRAILINQPHLMRVRLELAHAFFLRGDDALSKQHFERVLSGDPPPAMAVNIRRFLYTIRARRRWSGYLSLNIEQNDNINRGSDNETVYIFGLPFVVNEQSRPRAIIGLSLSGGGEYQYPFSRRWRWRFGANATRSDYEGDEFDRNYVLIRSGPRWLFSRRSEVSVQGLGAQQWMGGKLYSHEFGVLLNARHQLTQKFGVNGQVSHITTRYRQIPEADNTDLDSVLSLTWLFSPLVQGNVGGGFAYERFRIGVHTHSYRFNTGLNVILPWGWTVGSQVLWSQKRHGRNAPFLTVRRLDHVLTFRAFVLNRGLTFLGFSPQVIVTQERQQSNSVLDNYRHLRTDVRFVRQF